MQFGNPLAQSGIANVGPAGVGVLVLFFAVAAGTLGTSPAMPAGTYQFWGWCIALSTFVAPTPTKGFALLGITGSVGQAFDSLAWDEGGSNNLAGLSFVSAAPGPSSPFTVANQTDQQLEIYINYS